MWCCALRGQTGEISARPRYESGAAMEKNGSAHLWTRFGSVGEGIDWVAAFTYWWTCNSRVSRRTGSSSKITISNAIRGWRSSETG